MEQTAYNNLRFVIEEDLPGVGFYLYVYDNHNTCIEDYLQDSVVSIKQLALEKFGVPINSWKLQNK
jgi:hypothetical protein